MGFASLQSLWAFYLGILAESPNPFPMGRAVYALLALHRAEPLGIYARRPCRADCGATALIKQGCLKSVAHSRCTTQRHQRLTTRIGATPQTPLKHHFMLLSRFIECLRNVRNNIVYILDTDSKSYRTLAYSCGYKLFGR